MADSDSNLRLDPDQRAAVECDHPQILVLAGAGSGKTNTLVHRVAHLVERGVAPERIVLVTFTNRAATEMVRRAAARLGAAATRVEAGTFHQLAFRHLRLHGAQIGLPDRFRILDRRGAQSALGAALDGPPPPGLLDVLSYAVNADVPLGVAAEARRFDTRLDLEAVADRFAEEKAKRSALDFDDLLVAWDLLLATSPRDDVAHVLVDEFQDTNPIQARIAARLGGERFVVGDDMQSIYGFRGARHANIVELADDPHTAVFTLTTSYRCQPAILDVANGIVAGSRRQARPKTLVSPRPRGAEVEWLSPFDEADEAERVVARIRGAARYGDVAVLYRLHEHGDALEAALTRARVPFRVRGARRFFASGVARELCAYLAVLAGAAGDEAWRTVLLAQPGVGAVSVDRALTGADRRAPYAFLRRISRLVPLAHRLDEGAGGRVGGSPCLPEAIAALLEAEPFAAHRGALTSVARLAATHTTFDGLLADVLLASDPIDDDDAGHVTLSTVHQAKGLEWPTVIVLRVTEGAFPPAHAEDVEEERRLAFVAATRARDHLVLSIPRATTTASGPLPVAPSRLVARLTPPER